MTGACRRGPGLDRPTETWSACRRARRCHAKQSMASARSDAPSSSPRSKRVGTTTTRCGPRCPPGVVNTTLLRAPGEEVSKRSPCRKHLLGVAAKHWLMRATDQRHHSADTGQPADGEPRRLCVRDSVPPDSGQSASGLIGGQVDVLRCPALKRDRENRGSRWTGEGASSADVRLLRLVSSDLPWLLRPLLTAGV